MTEATPRPWATLISIEREPDDYAYAFRAVNQHDALVEALGKIAREPALHKTPHALCFEYRDIAQAALDAAKEGECGHLRRRSDLMAPPTITCIDCGADLNEGERRELSRLYQKDKEDTS